MDLWKSDEELLEEVRKFNAGAGCSGSVHGFYINRNLVNDEVFGKYWATEEECKLEESRRHFLSSYKLTDRPSFDEYFLMLAFDVAWRSEDVHIKQGAVIVNNKSKHIIGTGYNAAIKGATKKDVDFTNREARRPFMIHAEQNAILNCSINPINLPDGATIYITSYPCLPCLQSVINFGIRRVCVADRLGSVLEDEITAANRDKVLKIGGVELVKISPENKWVRKNFYEENLS